MINRKELIEEQKDCAIMLGMTLNEYQEYVKSTKIPAKEKESKNIEYDNSILSILGVDETILKKTKKYKTNI